MQLNTSTGYAVRIVIYLAKGHDKVSGAELSANTAVPATMLPGIVKPLRQAGIVETRRGNGGGFSLARSPEKITMADIVRAMEGTTRINRCLEPNRGCTLGIADTCTVRKFYAEVQDWLDETFEGKTIASFVTEQKKDKKGEGRCEEDGTVYSAGGLARADPVAER